MTQPLRHGRNNSFIAVNANRPITNTSITIAVTPNKYHVGPIGFGEISPSFETLHPNERTVVSAFHLEMDLLSIFCRR